MNMLGLPGFSLFILTTIYIKENLNHLYKYIHIRIYITLQNSELFSLE